MEKEERYRKFKETKQEKLRLEAAMEGFFAEKLSDITGAGREAEHEEEYGCYLKSHIRPAMEVLMKNGDIEKMGILAAQNWIGEAELNGFIQMALQRENRAVLLWLLHLKNREFGFKDRKFVL